MARALDVICLGRVAVDLYGAQVGGRLEEMRSFNMTLGGSSGNVAFGTARLGLRSSMFAKVGDEHLGRFLREELAREGCDVSHLGTDKERLTALVVLGIRGDGTFPHIFYRPDPADMALTADDVDDDYIGSATALAITGTHLSNPRCAEAVLHALTAARDRGTKTILDIDYRPVLWGLTRHGDGEDRFVASAAVTEKLAATLERFDVIVGTEEEFFIAGGSTDIVTALRAVRARSSAVLVCKRGPLGCVIFDGPVPDDVEQGLVCAGFSVPVLNTLGAGDAFMSGFLRGHLRGEDLATSARWGNACGALVVSREACAPAMPTWDELHDFMDRSSDIAEPAHDAVLAHRHRLASRRRPTKDTYILAFDHRTQMEELCDDPSRIAQAKGLLLQAARAAKLDAVDVDQGVIIDGRYGARALAEAADTDLLIMRPIELPGSRPVAFEASPSLGLELSRWPTAHTVKCLVRYRADDAAGLRAAQEGAMRTLAACCAELGNELLLEIIPGGDDRTDALVAALTRLYDLGLCPDWWKLPALPSAADYARVGQVIQDRDPGCRGVLVLGLAAPMDELCASLRVAATADVVRGFAVGRTIFAAPLAGWFAGDKTDAQLTGEVAARYRTVRDAFATARAAHRQKTPHEVLGDRA